MSSRRPEPLRAALPAGIEVWLVRWSSGSADADVTGLIAEERLQVQALQRPEDRVRFAATRSALREVLGARLGLLPLEVPIAIDEHKKPFVAKPGAPCFNVAHSGELGLIAVSAYRRVGVDVERVDPTIAWTEVACHVFGRDELAELGAAPAGEALERFYSSWVRKEAWLKARGTGFLADPRMNPASREDSAEAEEGVMSLEVDPDYRAALAWVP